MKDILDKWNQYVDEEEELEEGWKQKVAAGLIGLPLAQAVGNDLAAYAHDTQSAQDTTAQHIDAVGDTETVFYGGGSAENPFHLDIELPGALHGYPQDDASDIADGKQLANSWVKQEMLKLINDRAKQLARPEDRSSIRPATDFNFSSLTYTDANGDVVSNPVGAKMAHVEGQVAR